MFLTLHLQTRAAGSDGLLLERCVGDEAGWYIGFRSVRLFHDDERDEFDKACAGEEALGETEFLERLSDERCVFRIV